MFLRQTWSLLKQTLWAWSNENISRLAAATAYYAIFSIAPLLLITIAIIGFIFGEQAARGGVQTQLSNVMGEQAAGFVENMIRNASQGGTGMIATVISIALLLYAATNIFAALQDSLNTVWHVRPKPDRPWWVMLRDRGLAFVMILVIATILLASLVITPIISVVAGRLGGGVPFLLEGTNLAVSLGVFTLIFAAMFKYLPDVKVAWRDVFTGAVITAGLFTLGKWVLGYYLSRPSTTSVYGAAGSLVVLMLFAYYSAQIFFLGAKFTQLYACRDGRPIVPTANAFQYDPSPLPPSAEAERKQEGREKTEPAGGQVRQPQLMKRAGIWEGGATAPSVIRTKSAPLPLRSAEAASFSQGGKGRFAFGSRAKLR